MERQCGISMLRQRQGTPRCADDPVRRRNGRCRRTGQEADSFLKASLTEGGTEKGDRNNRFVTISDRA